MSNPFRTQSEKSEPDAIPEEPKESRKPINWEPFIIILLALFLASYILFGARSCAEQMDLNEKNEKAEATRRAPICAKQGQKNADAWAEKMRLKNPVIACLGAPCGGKFRCSVRSEEPAAVYGIECYAGDGNAEQPGEPSWCFFAGAK